MIKNLLNADEEPPPGIKVVVEETVVNPPAEKVTAETSERLEDIAVSDDAQILARTAETASLDEDAESLESLMADIENLEPDELDRLEREIESLPEAGSIAEPAALEKIEVQQVEEPTTTAPVAEKISESALEPTIFQTK
mgnify:CR=1 FL=1